MKLNMLLTQDRAHLRISRSKRPIDLLLGKREIITNPWSYINEEKVTRKQWKFSQTLADRFWKRWVAEYLPTLTKRTKWLKSGKPVQVGNRVVNIRGRQLETRTPTSVFKANLRVIMQKYEMKRFPYIQALLVVHFKIPNYKKMPFSILKKIVSFVLLY